MQKGEPIMDRCKYCGELIGDAEICACPGKALEARVEELEAENERLKDALSTLDVQGVTGMVEDWVCVPSVEWFQSFERINP